MSKERIAASFGETGWWRLWGDGCARINARFRRGNRRRAAIVSIRRAGQYRA
jgi:hypothetical protein